MADLPIGSDEGADIVEIIQASTQNKLAITASNAAKVDGSAVTQPVSGTVTSNQGTPNTASNKWPMEIVDSGGVNIATVNANSALSVQATLGNSTNKTVTMKTGNLVTTATTVDQVILTRTVTTGKTFYMQYCEMEGRQTAPAGGTSIVLGTVSLELPSGTKVISNSFLGGGAVSTDKFIYTFAEPIPVSSASVVRIVVTPAATTSFTWFANFGGYEI